MAAGSIIWTFMTMYTPPLVPSITVIKKGSTGTRMGGNISVTPYLTFFHVDVSFETSVKLHVLMSMPSNFVWIVLQSLMNMRLSDKCLSMESHVIGVDTPHNKSIASRVQKSYSAPKGGTYISSSSSFQTNCSRNITQKWDNVI